MKVRTGKPVKLLSYGQVESLKQQIQTFMKFFIKLGYRNDKVIDIASEVYVLDRSTIEEIFNNLFE